MFSPETVPLLFFFLEDSLSDLEELGGGTRAEGWPLNFRGKKGRKCALRWMPQRSLSVCVCVCVWVCECVPPTNCLTCYRRHPVNLHFRLAPVLFDRRRRRRPERRHWPLATHGNAKNIFKKTTTTQEILGRCRRGSRDTLFARTATTELVVNELFFWTGCHRGRPNEASGGGGRWKATTALTYMREKTSSRKAPLTRSA